MIDYGKKGYKIALIALIFALLAISLGGSPGTNGINGTNGTNGSDNVKLNKSTVSGETLDMNSNPIFNLSYLYSYYNPSCYIKFDSSIDTVCVDTNNEAHSKITPSYVNSWSYDYINDNYNDFYIYSDRYEFRLSNGATHTVILNETELYLDNLNLTGCANCGGMDNLSWQNEKVNKSGDTMTGNLSFISNKTIKINSSATVLIINETGNGGTSPQPFTGSIRWSKFTPSANYTVDLIGIKTTVIAGNFRMAIFNNSAGLPYKLLNETSSIPLYAVGYNTNTIPNTSIIAGTPYWIGAQLDNISAIAAYGTLTGGAAYQTIAYNNFPTTATAIADSNPYVYTISVSHSPEKTWCITVSGLGVLGTTLC